MIGSIPPDVDPAATLAAEDAEGTHEDFGEGREGLNRVDEDVKRDVGADGQCGLLQPLTCLGAECVGPGQSRPIAEKREKSPVVGIGAGVGGGLRNFGEGQHGAEAAAAAPTDAACGSVYTTRGTAS